MSDLKHKIPSHKLSKLPIPLVLFTSYIAAEKSDELIKGFCKELPTILKKINIGKKALEKKTKSVSSIKNDITEELKKLELAIITLRELYDEEEIRKNNRQKELQMFNTQISAHQNSKNALSNLLIKYAKAKDALDSVASETNQYKNAQGLIESYLTLQAMNEKFIQEEFESLNNFRNSESEKLELQKLSVKHKHDIMRCDKMLVKLFAELDKLKTVNCGLCYSINNHLECQKEKHLNWVLIKRWAYDTCQKIAYYKENPVYTHDFIKLLNEIEEFIGFAKQIIIKQES